MPGMPPHLPLECLSALLGCNVKHLPEEHHGPNNSLKIHNFVETHLWQEEFRGEFFVDVEKFFDPHYDYDFREMTDSSECSRGGEEYKRPVGWYRFALKVEDKYPDGNTWLGSIGWRSYSEAGEWPVSFHGTGIDGAKGIAKTYYRAGDGALYGHGVYSTPDIGIAELYAKFRKFTSKTDGKDYEVIVQNRVNPQKRKIIEEVKDYWLIPVPEGSTVEEEKKIATSSIRPYGILIREV